jgi:hypothetical protein
MGHSSHSWNYFSWLRYSYLGEFMSAHPDPPVHLIPDLAGHVDTRFPIWCVLTGMAEECPEIIFSLKPFCVESAIASNLHSTFGLSTDDYPAKSCGPGLVG